MFTSEKAAPYVYICTHKTTGQYYIGYRAVNTLPSSLDLGTAYFTSYKIVKFIGFENFDCLIYAEFLDGESAFKFEQQLITEHISDPLNINYYHNNKLTTLGMKFTDEHRRKLSEAKKNMSDETRLKISLAQKGKTRDRAVVEKIAAARRGKKMSDKAKENMSLGHKNSKLTAEERKVAFARKTLPKEVYDKIADSNRGRKHTDEARKNMSLGGKGKKQSVETCAKRSTLTKGSNNPNAKGVYVLGEYYACKKEVFAALGWSRYDLNLFLLTGRIPVSKNSGITD